MKTLLKDHPKPIVVKGLAGDHGLVEDDIVSVKPIPVELKWEMSEEEFEEYGKIALKVMASNREFKEESLRRFLRKNDFLVYPIEKVIRLLRLKNCDLPHLLFLTESEMNHAVHCHGSDAQLSGFKLWEGVFHDFVPLRVIKKINLTQSQFPEISCFISYYKNNANSEVFAAISFKGGSQMWVIDMWNKERSIVGEGE